MFERTASAGHLTSWASRLFTRAIDRRCRSMGLSVAQVPVLLALQEETKLTQKQLVERCAIAQPAMVAILKRMEAADLVRRLPDPEDGRVSRFDLTAKSTAALPALFKALGTGNSIALQGLDEDEQQLLVALLRKLIRNMNDEEARLNG